MPWLSPFPVLIWAVIFVPFTYLVWTRRPTNKLHAILVWLSYFLVNLYFFQSVNWVIVGYWIRLIPVAAALVIAFRYLSSWKRERFLPPKNRPAMVVTVVCLVVILAAGAADAWVTLSTRYQPVTGKPMLAQFPVRNGMYVVVNGGNGNSGVSMNTDPYTWFGSRTYPTIQTEYALDIFKMSTSGGYGSGMLPDSHLEYDIFDDFVYSPCMGSVVYVEDGHKDTDLSGTPETALGNFIVIHCADFYVTLSSLEAGSMLVNTGDFVRLSMMIAHVGSSGYPPVPHLHVQANRGSWKGDQNAVPILFEGMFAVDQFAIRNQIFVPQN